MLRKVVRQCRFSPRELTESLANCIIRVFLTQFGSRARRRARAPSIGRFFSKLFFFYFYIYKNNRFLPESPSRVSEPVLTQTDYFFLDWIEEKRLNQLSPERTCDSMSLMIDPSEPSTQEIRHNCDHKRLILSPPSLDFLFSACL